MKVLLLFAVGKSIILDFPYYLSMIDGAFMSRMNTLVVPGGKMGLAMELILTPLIRDLMDRKNQANKQLDWMSDL